MTNNRTLKPSHELVELDAELNGTTVACVSMIGELSQ